MKRFLPFIASAIASLCIIPSALSQKVVGVINVGGQPGLLAINPATNMIYVPNATLKTVTVVDGGSNQVVANISMPSPPVAAAVNPATNLIYVTTGYPSNSVVVIDGYSNTVTATIAATLPGFIAVNSATNLVYFSNVATTLSVVDGSTNQITHNIATSYGIEGIAVNQVTNRIYLSESAFPNNQVAVVDGRPNRAFSFQISGACFLTSVAVDSTLNRIYIVDNNCGGVYTISGVTNKLLNTILRPGYYGPMGLNSAEHTIADFGVSSTPVLSFVNGRTDKTLGTLAFPSNGQSPIIVVAGNGNRYYVAFSNSYEIAVVSGSRPSSKHPAGRSNR